MSRVLVVKLGALGDFVLAFGPFAAIRARHPGCRDHAADDGAFRRRWPGRALVRPPWRPMTGRGCGRSPDCCGCGAALRGFDMVYDLQTSSRSGWYHRLAGRPAWSGIAPGCSHPHANPGRDAMHTVERQREQLEMAGIDRFPAPELGWLRFKPSPLGKGLGEGAGARPHVPAPHSRGEGDARSAIVLIPGAALHRPRQALAGRAVRPARGHAGRPAAAPPSSSAPPPTRRTPPPSAPPARVRSTSPAAPPCWSWPA